MTTDELRAAFKAQFNAEPYLIASAPGRVNIIGEHTDYNGGEVLPIAIDRRTLVAVSARENAKSSRVVSTSESASGEFDARSPVRAGAWGDYVAGVCASITSDGVTPSQFNALVASDVPIGAGLSASAALEAATAPGPAGLTKRTQDSKHH